MNEVIKIRIRAKDPKLISLISEFNNNYLPLVKSRDEDTINSYKYSIDIYLSFLREEYGITLRTVISKDFNQNNIVKFTRWLQEKKGNAAPTINHRLSNIRIFTRFLMKNGAITPLEYELIREIDELPDERCIEFEWLSVDDVKLILQQVKKNRNGIRDFFLISLLYESGARVDEILSLTPKDLTYIGKDGLDVHFLGKGKKHRTTPLNGKIRELCQEYCLIYHSEKDMNNFLFYTVRNGSKCKMSSDNVARILSECEKNIKLIKPDLIHLHAHLFRRTRAMHLFLSGVPLPTVSDWLGHSNIETTRIYAKVTEEMKRDAVKVLSQSDNSVFAGDTDFTYAEDEVMLRRLCGLPRK